MAMVSSAQDPSSPSPLATAPDRLAPILARRILSSLNHALPVEPPAFPDPDRALRTHPQPPQPLLRPPDWLECPPLERIGAGLANLGNTCFLNSVLQCLTYTPPFATYLQSGLHSFSCGVVGFCAMCALESHVKQALLTSGRIVSPTYLAKNLRCISRSFQMWRQEDAHEYMRYLIEALQTCCHSGEVSGGASLGSQKTLIQKIFGGRLRSQVKCTQCSQCSNTFDPFLDLSLEIVRADSLLKALARFTAVEVLDGDNMYQCSRCKTKVRALKQFTVDKAPPILTVQFKRFSSSGGFGGKIDKRVHFNPILDMKPFVNGGEDKELKYSLYGVLVHSGWSTHSGHYYCFVRTATDTWHVLDDSRVSQVTEKAVLEQKAYILFYMRDTKVTKVSNDNDHGQNVRDVSYGANIEVNGTSRMKGVCSIDTEIKVDGTPGTDGNLKAHLAPNGFGLSDSPECSADNNTSTSGDPCLESCSPRCDKSVELLSSGDVSVEVEKSQRQNIGAHAEDASAHLCRGNSNGHLEDGQSSGIEAGQLPVPETKSKQTGLPFFNVMASVARTTFLEVAGQHALNILSMCAEFCIWSCFWSQD